MTENNGLFWLSKDLANGNDKMKELILQILDQISLDEKGLLAII